MGNKKKHYFWFISIQQDLASYFPDRIMVSASYSFHSDNWLISKGFYIVEKPE